MKLYLRVLGLFIRRCPYCGKDCNCGAKINKKLEEYALRDRIFYLKKKTRTFFHELFHKFFHSIKS